MKPMLDRSLTAAPPARSSPKSPARAPGRSQTRSLGETGERLAAGYLRRRGYRIVGRNLRTQIGEIDILALGPRGTPRPIPGRFTLSVIGTLIGRLLRRPEARRPVVVVEVKTRRTATAGRSGGSKRGGVNASRRSPEAAITQAKTRKLYALLDLICKANNWQDRPKRIDIVAIDIPETKGRPEIRHYPGMRR